MAQILIVEDEPMLARSIREALSGAGHQAVAVGSAEEGLRCVEAPDRGPWDMILLDLRLPGMDGLELLRTLRSRDHVMPVVMMTAHGSIESAVEVMKAGAADFLTKPLDLQALDIVVERVLKHQRVVDSLDYFRNRERAASGLGGILGDSPQMSRVRDVIAKLIRSPALAGAFPPSILICGETGTGKDLVARAIHYEGPRAEAPFVHVNCTAVPDELFEAELFGHVKGAFTSATGAKKGLMHVADGGTIFLDEIGHMKPALQAKLLTVIERKAIRPVGATAEREVNVHVVSATNRDLAEAVEQGAFRPDLYHRLQVVQIDMPPLRDRPEDVAVFAEHFVRLYAGRYGAHVEGVSRGAIECLRRYRWPGNVRELSHTIERAVLMCEGRILEAEDLQPHLPSGAAAAGARIDLPDQTSIALDFDAGTPTMEELENAILDAALRYHGHNVSKTARILGLTRETVRYRLEKRRVKPSGGD